YIDKLIISLFKRALNDHEHILLEVGSNCFYIYYLRTVLSDTCVALQYGLKNRGIWTSRSACWLLFT
ncbi:hypothetical protein, partial [Salmonella sp. 741265100_HSA]|uniref:hypothetical protein n=1 Tax=Salmonella sp. 741265100_HSA TaxID=3389023 RepID=UPI003980E1FF